MCSCNKLCGVFMFVTTALFAVGIHWLITYKVQVPQYVEDDWWGPENRKVDTSVRPMTVNVPDAVLKDLKYRLEHAKFQMDLRDGDFNYGFQASYMKEIVKHWIEKFDWRKQEAIINTFSHYKTNIEGLDVHFIHEKPKNKNSVPLLLAHGWPSSFWEFYKIISMLTDTKSDITFEVICPSVPGFAYSDSPQKKGFDHTDTGRIYMKLMKRLGFEKYYVQGGDFGAMTLNFMAALYPQYILGFHSIFLQPPSLPKSFIKMAVGSFLPSFVYEKEEIDNLQPISYFLKEMIKETGYLHLQSTKPDTVGIALTDSPVGLAAYILEKYSSGSGLKYRETKDGGLTKHFTLDELLTNIMIYWTNQNVVSSLRLYKELFLDADAQTSQRIEIIVPVGLAMYPGDLMQTPRSLAADIYKDIVQYTVMPRGGHFAALEEPHLFTNDLKNFVRKVELKRNRNK